MEARLFELDSKMASLRERMSNFPSQVANDYQQKLDVSWLFHDSALEGVVLSYSELKAATDQRIISDVTLIPMYEEVKNHKIAMDFIRDAAHAKKPPVINLELIRKLYGFVTPDAVAKGCPYRKETPLHRLYYHEIAPSEKIIPNMRQIDEWVESAEYRALHPVVAATQLQLKVLHAYPWTQNTGKVARLLTNFILLREGYLPAVIHSIERQRYYEVLRHDNEGLLFLVLESLENSIEITMKFFDELGVLKMRRAS
jgi:Fic family protein